jgi:hypothetical protein
LKDNYLGDYESVQYFIKSTRELVNLDMRGNPIAKAPKFHESIVVLLPKLCNYSLYSSEVRITRSERNNRARTEISNGSYSPKRTESSSQQQPHK